MISPSKELLSAVLGRDVKEGIGRIVLNDNILTFVYSDEDIWSDINIYELMHMMKEWAVEQVDMWKQAFIMSKRMNFGTHYGWQCFCNIDGKINESIGDNEFDVVLTICEWILEQQK